MTCCRKIYLPYMHTHLIAPILKQYFSRHNHEVINKIMLKLLLCDIQLITLLSFSYETPKRQDDDDIFREIFVPFGDEIF